MELAEQRGRLFSKVEQYCATYGLKDAGVSEPYDIEADWQ
jgi:hypothetical protein